MQAQPVPKEQKPCVIATAPRLATKLSADKLYKEVFTCTTNQQKLTSDTIDAFRTFQHCKAANQPRELFMPTKIVSSGDQEMDKDEQSDEDALELESQSRATKKEVKPIFQINSNQTNLDQEALKFLTVHPKLSPQKNNNGDQKPLIGLTSERIRSFDISKRFVSDQTKKTEISDSQQSCSNLAIAAKPSLPISEPIYT